MLNYIYILVAGCLAGTGHELAELHAARALVRRQQVLLRPVPGEARRAALPDAQGPPACADLQPQQVGDGGGVHRRIEKIEKGGVFYVQDICATCLRIGA